MKKYIINLLLCLFSTQLFAYDEQAYQRLVEGHKDLSGADLQSAEINDIDLTGVNFTNTNLSNAKFCNVILTNVTFDHSMMYRAEFHDSVLRDCNLLNGVNLNHSIIMGTTFDHSRIVDSSFDYAKMQNTDFLNSEIINTTMNELGNQEGLDKLGVQVKDKIKFAAEKISFISCMLSNISFIRSKIQCLLICDTNEIGRQINFYLTEVSGGMFLGKESKSFLRQCNFQGAHFGGCLFLNIYLDNCINIETSKYHMLSIFQNISSTNSNDISYLLSHGAKVNGTWGGADKDFWTKTSDSDFFTDLMQMFELGIAQGAGYAVAIKLIAAAAPAACVVQ